MLKRFGWIGIVLSVLVGMWITGCNRGVTDAEKASDGKSSSKKLDPASAKAVSFVRQEVSNAFPKQSKNLQFSARGKSIQIGGYVASKADKNSLDQFITGLDAPRPFKLVNGVKVGKPKDEAEVTTDASPSEDEDALGAAAAAEDEGTVGSAAFGEEPPAKGRSPKTMAFKPYRFAGKTYVLLKDVAKAFRLKIKWEKETSAVIITKPNEDVSTASEVLGQALMQRGKMYVTPAFVKKELGYAIKLR